MVILFQVSFTLPSTDTCGGWQTYTFQEKHYTYHGRGITFIYMFRMLSFSMLWACMCFFTRDKGGLNNLPSAIWMMRIRKRFMPFENERLIECHYPTLQFLFHKHSLVLF